MKSRLMKFVLLGLIVVLSSCIHRTVVVTASKAQAGGIITPNAPKCKIYAVNSMFYPYVMFYFRTMDANQDPLVNMTPYNVGLMVKGRAYDPKKGQYRIETLKNRKEGFRTLLLLDCSKSMDGYPFRDLIAAARDYIRLKRPSDEIGIMAMTDTVESICEFTKDARRLETFLTDLTPTGIRTRLYDGIGKAMMACTTARGTMDAGSPEYVVLSNIVVITDGVDEGSAFTQQNILDEIRNLKKPIPIYSIIYTGKPGYNIRSLASLSARSFGKFWTVTTTSEFARICETIQEINRHDYVGTFRAYLPVDGERHNFKIGVQYEGKMMQDSAYFETMDFPPTPETTRIKMALRRKIPPIPGGNPYYEANRPDTMAPPPQSYPQGQQMP